MYLSTSSVLLSVYSISLTKILAWRDVFTTFFQIFGRKFKTLAFSNDVQEFTLHTHMFSAVAFMPPDNVIASFGELSDLISGTYQGQVDNPLNCFQEAYIGRYRRNVERRPTLFSLDLWYMLHRTFDELPRTNNHVERWHWGFQEQVLSCHSVFWKFINLPRIDDNI